MRDILNCPNNKLFTLKSNNLIIDKLYYFSNKYLMSDSSIDRICFYRITIKCVIVKIDNFNIIMKCGSITSVIFDTNGSSENYYSLTSAKSKKKKTLLLEALHTHTHTSHLGGADLGPAARATWQIARRGDIARTRWEYCRIIHEKRRHLLVVTKYDGFTSPSPYIFLFSHDGYKARSPYQFHTVEMSLMIMVHLCI